MKKWATVRIEDKNGKFIDYNVCESISDAKRYCKLMNKNFKATIVKIQSKGDK